MFELIGYIGGVIIVIMIVRNLLKKKDEPKTDVKIEEPKIEEVKND